MSPTFRALRAGVLLGDNLVEERVFRTDASITFGQSLKCTLSVPADGAPAEHVLFAVDQGRFLLRAPARMTGRVAQGGATIEVGDVAIPLERGARGKLQVGEATLLFQEVAAPPIVPRPQLPASVRGSFGDRIDRKLAGIVAISLFAHLAIATWAWMMENESSSMAEEVAAQYDPPRYEVIEMPDLDFGPVPSEPSTEPGVAAPVKPEQIGTPKPRDPVFTQLPDPGDAERWAQVITGNQPGRDGQAELPNRLPDADLDRQIRAINDRGQEVANPRTTSRERDPRLGDGPPGPTIKEPGIGGPPKEERQPIARITPIPQPKKPGKDPLSINAVLARIQGAYMAGLQRCYVKHGLATDASMVAKVTISFVVDPTGASTENQARGANAEVDGCIRDQMAGWKFSVPKDDDGDPTDAPFKLQLALQPS
jgi:hypothetical protein